MKKPLKPFLHFCAAFTIVATTAFGQTNSLWTLDENGPAFVLGGAYDDGGPPHTGIVGFSRGTNKVDTISGIIGWYYVTGPNTAGDVVILEAPQFTTISDLLRFDGNGVFFFSQLELNDPNPPHADVPVIPNPINPVVLNEVDLGGGSNGVTYIPEVGQPGYSLFYQIPKVHYNIVSDVPEPGPMVLVGFGALTLWPLLKRKRA
jgi:hypothetical protein